MLERSAPLLLERDGQRAGELEAGDSVQFCVGERPAQILRLQGQQLATQLCAVRPGLRVLFVSGFTESSVVHQGVVGDGVAFLPKPYSADGMALAVRRVIDGQP